MNCQKRFGLQPYQIRRLFSTGLTYLVMGVILFYILFPIYWLALSSLRSPNTVFTVDYLPTHLSTLNYRLLPLNEYFVVSIQNSLVVAGVVLVLTLGLGSVAAYALGRLRFRGRRLTRYAILAMTAFPQVAIVGGLYVLIANPCVLFGGECRELSLYNTRTSLVISYMILTLPLTIWFMAAFYRSLPQELEDAAYVDGATSLQTFYHIFLPLSLPGLVITGLISLIVAWNEFLFALTFTIDSSSRTAPVSIAMLGGWGTLTNLAAAVMVTLPVVVLAVALRRQLTSGLTGIYAHKAAPPPGAEQTERWGWSRLDVATRILLIMLGLTLLSFIHYGWSAILFPYPLDYGEGPLLDQTRRLAQLENIYRPALDHPPYTITNYPPLFMLLQVPFMALFGPAYWYGRLIAWLSTVAAALLAGLIIHSLSRDRLAAVITGLTLLAVPHISAWSPLNRIDPLALGLSLAALWVLVRWPQRRWSLGLTAGLLIAAVYTRQSYGLAAPLAAFGWLLSRPPRRRAFLLAGLVAGGGLALFGLLQTVTGGFFFHVVTSNVNQFEWERLAEFGADGWIFLPYLLVGGGLFLLLGGWFRVRSWWLIGPYLVGATLTALTIGKAGSNINYFLELGAALSLAAGALIAWQRPRPWLRQTLVLILALQIYLVLPGIGNHLFVQSRIEQPQSMAHLLTLVEQADGPLLADDPMGFLPLAGRPLYAQPFEISQLAYSGVWDQTPFVDSIEQQAFSTIIILRVMTPFGPLDELNWTPEMLEAIDNHYRQVELINESIAVYAPK